MPSNLPRYARILTATLALGGLLLAAVPASLADPASRPAPAAAATERGAATAARMGKDFVIELQGTGHDRENHSYTLVVDGEGRGVVKKDAAGNVTEMRGLAKLRIVVEAENGTVVKDRELRAVVRGHLTADGWVWTLHGFGKHERGYPQLHLRGTATKEAPGVIELEGQGRAAFARTIPGPSLRMTIDSATGSITRL